MRTRIDIEEAELQPDDGVGVEFMRDTNLGRCRMPAGSRTTITMAEARELLGKGSIRSRAIGLVQRMRHQKQPIRIVDATDDEMKEIVGYDNKTIDREHVK